MTGAMFACAVLIGVALHGPIVRAAKAGERIAAALEKLARLADRGRP